MRPSIDTARNCLANEGGSVPHIEASSTARNDNGPRRKHNLVTGGISGIGRTLAEELHRKGNKVVIAGRRQALLDEVTGRHPGMVGIAVDLSDSAAIAKFAESVKNQFPELNV